jgi:cellulose synthase/poly-beta-1,6-N-acetylglucosamine synthase-like glycosyltransferase
VDVIVAVLDEAATIDAKLRELAATGYPADRLRVIVVDGGSSDGTREILAAHAERLPDLDVVLTRLADKTAQLNEGLARARAPWILVTDADASLPAETIGRLVSAGEADPAIGVVGVPAVPADAHPLDRWHWHVSNGIRRLEHRVGTTGLVVASCYLFRRSLLDRFPADAVADDVHVACLAASAGSRVALVDIEVTELRAATTGFLWYCHKVRRARGYLREVFRFLPHARRMTPPAAAVFLWRAAALTLAPVAGVVSIIAMLTSGGMELVADFAGFAALALVCRGDVARVSQLGRVFPGLTLPLWTLAITMTALVTYPFVRQTAHFPKVGAPVRRAPVA